MEFPKLNFMGETECLLNFYGNFWIQHVGTFRNLNRNLLCDNLFRWVQYLWDVCDNNDYSQKTVSVEHRPPTRNSKLMSSVPHASNGVPYPLSCDRHQVDSTLSLYRWLEGLTLIYILKYLGLVYSRSYWSINRCFNVQKHTHFNFIFVNFRLHLNEKTDLGGNSWSRI